MSKKKIIWLMKQYKVWKKDSNLEVKKGKGKKVTFVFIGWLLFFFFFFTHFDFYAVPYQPASRLKRFFEENSPEFLLRITNNSDLNPYEAIQKKNWKEKNWPAKSSKESRGVMTFNYQFYTKSIQAVKLGEYFVHLNPDKMK